MAKMRPIKTHPSGGKAVVMQTGTKAGIKTFKPGYNYSKKLGK